MSSLIEDDVVRYLARTKGFLRIPAFHCGYSPLAVVGSHPSVVSVGVPLRPELVHSIFLCVAVYPLVFGAIRDCLLYELHERNTKQDPTVAA